MDEKTIYALLRNEDAPLEERLRALKALGDLEYRPDLMLAVPALKAAIHSPHEELMRPAMILLYRLEDARATRVMLGFARDKEQSDERRIPAVMLLGITETMAARKFITQLAFDETESLQLRSNAIEWGYGLLFDDAEFDHFDALLAHPAPELRHAAAHGLEKLAGFTSISPMFERLDQLAAEDDAITEDLDWTVGREALSAVMLLLTRAYILHDDLGPLFVVSPAGEFMRYDPEAEPPDLNIDPAWLRERISEHWDDVDFDLEPTSTALVLTWAIGLDDDIIIGGLHRDGYAIALRGHEDLCCTFAAWVAKQFEDQQFVMHEWGDKGVEIEPGMTGTELCTAYDKRRRDAVRAYEEMLNAKG